MRSAECGVRNKGFARTHVRCYWVVVADVSRRKSCPTARRLSNNGLRSGWRESLKFARTDVRGYVVVVADVSRR
jgi:hypothetical protein